MIKTEKVLCKWCGRSIHGIHSYGVVQCECSHCADVFVVSVEETEGNCEVTKND